MAWAFRLIPVSPAREGIAAGRDEILERGIQAVR